LCHYDAHSNQQASNTEYWYYDGLGPDYFGTWPGWNRSIGQPPANVKTHLVSFAPWVSGSGSGIEAPPSWFIGGLFKKPAWTIRLAYEPSSGYPAGTRTCFLICHMSNGNQASMLAGFHYYPPPATDDSWTY
jgi:hypothetical protein